MTHGALVPLVTLAALASVTPTVARSSCVNYEEKMHWVKDVALPALTVELLGDIAYVISNDGPRTLHILDVAEPESPFELGVLPLDVDTRQMAVDGDLLVVGGDTQLRVIDVSNPTTPILMSVIPWGRTLSDVALQGDLCVAVGMEPGDNFPYPPGLLRAYDVSHPDAPVEVQAFALPERGSRVELRGDRAFVGTQVPFRHPDVYGELRIYQVAPTWTLLGTAALHGAPDCIGLHASTAYVGEGYLLKTIDFSNESAPYVSSVHTTGRITNEARVVGDILYIVNSCAFSSFDLAVPAHPVPLPTLNGLTLLTHFAINGTRALFARYDALSLFERPNAGLAHELGHADVPGYITDVALTGDHAVLSTLDRGLRIVNVADPSAPYAEGFAYSANTIDALGIIGNYAIAVCSSLGIRVFDISDPTAPQFVRLVNTWSHPRAIGFSGNYAFLPGQSSLFTIDLHDPPHAIIVATTAIPSQFGRIAIREGIAYISSIGQPSLLYSVDIADPLNPTMVGQVQTPPLQDLEIEEDRLYAVGSDGDAYCFDLATPTMPVMLQSFGMNDADAIAVGDGAALVQHEYGRATLLDIVGAPRGLGSLTDGSCEYDINELSAAVERDGVFYAGVGRQGLWTFARPCLAAAAPELSVTSAPRFVGRPNPFRPAVDPEYRIDLLPSGSASAALRILNAAGRVVRRISVSESRVAPRAFVWDARDDRGLLCPSGVYLYRSEGANATGRVIVIR